MADDASAQGVAVPAREPGIATRRGLAFLLDLALIVTLRGIVTMALTALLPSEVLTLLRGAIAFNWWCSSAWLKDGRTPGMLITGLEVRDAWGTPAPGAAHIKRAAFLTVAYTPLVLELIDALPGVELSQRFFAIQFGIAIGYAGFAALQLVAGGNAWLLHDRWSGAGVWRVGRAHVPPIVPGRSAIRRAVTVMVIAMLPALVLEPEDQGCFSNFSLRPASIPSELEQVLESRLEAGMGVRAKVAFGQASEWSSKSGRTRWLALNVQVPKGTFSPNMSQENAAQLWDSLIVQTVTEINRRHLDVHEFDGLKLTISSPMSTTYSGKVRFKRRDGTARPAPHDST